MTRSAIASRENVALRSDDFNNAYWSKFQVAVTSDAAAGLLSGTTADLITEDANVGEHAVYRPAFASTVGRQFCHWAVVKAASRSWVSLLPDNGVVRAWFNLSTGAVGTVMALGGYSAQSYITSLGSGWYLCEVVSTFSSSGGQLTIEPQTADATIGYLGTGLPAFYMAMTGVAYANWSGPFAVTAGVAVDGPIRNLASRS